MPTECTPDLFEFEPVEGRRVVAAFDGGAITSDAGALLLGATDLAINMMQRFAACFDDVRRQELIEHEVVTLVGQRVFGIALGYEDLNDHDELRHDPMMAVLAGKLEAKREECAPVAGKSTLNRLELSRLQPTRYHKISYNPIAIKRLLVDLFLEAHERPPRSIVLDLDATDDPVHGEQGGAVLPRLLRLLLLSASVCILRPPFAGGQAAPRQSGCCGWCAGGGGEGDRPYSPQVAESPHCAACR